MLSTRLGRVERRSPEYEGKGGPSVRSHKSQKPKDHARRPRLAVVAEQLAAVRDEPVAVGRASRLRVALTRKAQERSMVRREIAALRRDNAALKSELGAGDAPEPASGSGSLETVDVELPGGSNAPGLARSEVRDAIETVVPEDHLAMVILLTSELVTNAVVHAQQPDDATIGLRIIRSQNRLRLEVTDSGSGFNPAARRRPDPGGGGLGLLLVATLSDRWGTTRRTSSQRQWFCVWFELRHTPSYSRRPSAPCMTTGPGRPSPALEPNYPLRLEAVESSPAESPAEVPMSYRAGPARSSNLPPWSGTTVPVFDRTGAGFDIPR